MTTATTNLTPKSLELFLWYAKDASNWSGLPYIGGNREFTKADRGNLTQMKRAGLLSTRKDEFGEYITFSESGRELAKQHGIEIES